MPQIFSRGSIYTVAHAVHVTSLRVFDNSAEPDPMKGKSPLPVLVLEIAENALVFPPTEKLADTPAWAKPIVLAACKHAASER